MDHSHDGPAPASPSSSHSVWSQERLTADVHRAVGGCLNLVREVSRLSNELDAEMPTEWMIKRTLFFAYELASVLPDGLPEHERLTFLNRFFFSMKCFKCLKETAHLKRPSDAFRLSRVLAARAGAPMMVALLYAFLAERIGITLEFVDLNSGSPGSLASPAGPASPIWFLRWNENGRSRYIDITRAGRVLSSDELIEILHSKQSRLEPLLEALTFEHFLVAHITDLKSTLSCAGSRTGAGATAAPNFGIEKLLFLQNALIAYQPSNLQRLAERAVLHRKLGNFKSALADLKRFFAFHDRDKCKPELLKLHAELLALINREP